MFYRPYDYKECQIYPFLNPFQYFIKLKENLILPIFVIEGEKQRQEVKTMPGVFRQSIDQVVLTAKEAEKKGTCVLF